MRRKLVFTALAVVLATTLSIWVFQKRESAEPRSDVVTLRLGSFNINLDPRSNSDAESRTIQTLLHVGLVRVLATGEVMPAIAERYTTTGEGMEFIIRSGLKFSDGSDLSVREVAQSLCQSAQPPSLFSWALSAIRISTAPIGKSDDCSGIAVDDAKRSVTILTRPGASVSALFEALASPAGWITKGSPSEGAFRSVAGVGPYKLGRTVPGETLELVPNSQAALRSRIAYVRFTHVPNDQQAVSAFRSGKLDLMEVLSPLVLDGIGLGQASDPQGFTVLRSPVLRTRVAILNEKKLLASGLKPVHVEAIKNALRARVPRQELETASKGLATASVSPFPFGGQAHSIDGSGQGVNVGRSLELVTMGDPYSDMIAAQIARTVKSPEIKYVALERGAFFARLVAADYDIAVLGIESILTGPRFWLNFFAPGSPLTAFGKEIPALNQLASMSEEQLLQSLSMAEQEGNWVGLLRDRAIWVASPHLSGIRFTPAGQISLEELHRR
jgi:hypothetical protein